MIMNKNILWLALHKIYRKRGYICLDKKEQLSWQAANLQGKNRMIIEVLFSWRKSQELQQLQVIGKVLSEVKEKRIFLAI